MARRRSDDPEAIGGSAIRFSLVGLVIFSFSLVVSGGLLTLGGMMTVRAYSGRGPSDRATAAILSDVANTTADSRQLPPWGELITRQISVERPEEYIGFETQHIDPVMWTFEEMSRDAARREMIDCGLTPNQADRALALQVAPANPTATTIKPDDDLLFSLAPETRSKLYRSLARFGSNHYMQYPFNLPATNLDEWLSGSKVSAVTLDRLKRLLYPHGGVQSLSDVEPVARTASSQDEKFALFKALSRQPALLVQIHVRPETDLSQVLGYWGRGLQMKDARPLLESLQRVPGGGSANVVFLLPRFARDRLYTFPAPPKPGDAPMDCHWSTMNFFNDPPDDRFCNPEYTVQYLKTNYYAVARPSLYGDVILVLNEEGNAIHSAVYLADDIVFTKNGNNYAQPWTLVHMKDLAADYSPDGNIKLSFYRNKNW
jgi:hypothetical protein